VKPRLEREAGGAPAYPRHRAADAVRRLAVSTSRRAFANCAQLNARAFSHNWTPPPNQSPASRP